MTEFTLTRAHRSRLMQIWRSAGWPCQDALELELLAAGLLQRQQDGQGRETLRLSDSGVGLLAAARQGQTRALSVHDRLAARFAQRVLMPSGRLVWRELSLRAQIEEAPAPELLPPSEAPTLLPDLPPPAPRTPHVWRLARPDLFSVRHTSVEAYLQPMVHEVKASRADLLSDLRHAAKRQAYEWLCSECYYVFPASIAKPNEIPLQFGVWLQHGSVDEPEFELARPARHQPCTLPFAVWLALAKATPLERDEALAGADAAPAQAPLGDAQADAPADAA